MGCKVGACSASSLPVDVGVPMNRSALGLGLALVVGAVAFSQHLAAQNSAAGGEWRTYGADLASAMLRAYDKATGDEVGAVYLPAPQTGSPMTYMTEGKQYLVVAVSGGTYSGELLAFTVPGA